MSNVAVHVTHCCPIHGCKYGDVGCPIELKKIDPYYPHNNGCERCEDEREMLDTMTHTVTVKAKGSQNSHTEKKVFSHKPSDDEIKSVVSAAKKTLKAVTGQPARTVDTSVSPGGKGGDEDESLVLS